MFSKVSRSLAQFTLVNSVSTLLNKGGITCNCPRASQDFCVNQNKQASAQLLCSSLGLSRHERSEGRRNSCEAEKYTHSEQHAPLQGCREDISGVLCSSWPTHNMPNMPKPCHKHAKVHADVCSGKKHLPISKDRSRANQKKAYFLPGSAKSAALGQVKRVGCEYVTHLPAYAGKRGQRPFLGSSSPNPVSRAGATGWRAQSLNYLSRTPRTLLRESRSYCLAEPWLFLPGDSKSA